MLENLVGVIISIRIKLYPAVCVRKKTCRFTVKKVVVTDLKSNKYVFDSVLNQTKGAPQKKKNFNIKSYNYLIQSNIDTITRFQILAFTAALG